MKHSVLIAIVLLTCFTAQAQSNYNFVDRKIKEIPKKEASSIAYLANYISMTFQNEQDKIRAAYTWVIENISYDTDSMYAINWNKSGQLKIPESFRRRKGVCENFAGIFIDIVSKAGLTGVTIDGYTRQGNQVNKTGHTWCAVMVAGDWFLFDPTWDKDRSIDYSYFMALPSQFASTHMPFDPLWQLTDTPNSHQQFQNRGKGKSELLINHNDSVKAYMRLSELKKLEARARRMAPSETISELIRNRLAFVRMQIATLYEEIDMHLYNAAVENFNKATQAYNNFLQKGNGQLTPAETAGDFNSMLAPALTLIQQAQLAIADMGKVIPNYQFDPTALKIRLDELAEKIRMQKLNGVH